MDPSVKSLSCGSCNEFLSPDRTVCPKCGATIDVLSATSQNLKSEETVKPEDRETTPPVKEPGPPLIDLDKMENALPWNGVMLALIFIFLLLTYVNK